MSKRMLIDASHPEETRVVVLDGNKVEEFDFESASRRPLKGNIYLAKVTRVEPSLQAAFVEYGGNRQGFLAFAEIHPDYYQIPIADPMALLAEQEAEERRRADDDIESVETTSIPAQESAAEAAASVQDVSQMESFPGEEQPDADPSIHALNEQHQDEHDDQHEPTLISESDLAEVAPGAEGAQTTPNAAGGHDEEGVDAATPPESKLHKARPAQGGPRKRHN